LSVVLTDDVPAGVVTVTSTAPVPSDGLTARICVSLATVTFAEAFEPNCTDVAPVNPEPVITRLVPPAPLVGLTPETAGKTALVESGSAIVLPQYVYMGSRAR
jgi:hypothetical protein